MNFLIDFLLANPFLIGIPLLLAVVVAVFIVKKLVKAAVIAAVLFLLFGAALWYFADDAIKEQGKELLRDVKDNVKL